MSATATYDPRFFDRIREGAQASAEIVVPVVLEQLQPGRVVDVGCGEGHWGKAFETAGSRVLGIDGEYVRDPVIPFFPHDLTETLPDEIGHFDLAVCLEVVEHLPPERAPSFIEELCELADFVLFSAAIPGQGGDGHLNEQWPAYWLELFRRQGKRGTGALRWQLWHHEQVCWWYRQNLFFFGELGPEAPIDELAVVHPAAWRHHGHA